MACQQPVGLGGAVAYRERARDLEWIEAVYVAAAGQHIERAYEVAAGRRAHVAAIQGVQQGRRLVVRAEQVDHPRPRFLGDAEFICERFTHIAGRGRADDVQAARDQRRLDFVRARERHPRGVFQPRPYPKGCGGHEFDGAGLAWMSVNSVRRCVSLLPAACVRQCSSDVLSSCGRDRGRP